MVTWDTIECIEQNGIITGYAVVFQERGGANVPGSVNTVDRTFSAGGLTPGTGYTFQVAGISDVGRGPFTEITITTDEEGLSRTKLYSDATPISLQFLVLCLTLLVCSS